MRPRKNHLQESLFEVPRIQELRNRVRELDAAIASALKRRDYPEARELTQEQERIIQQLVDMGESDVRE